MVVVTRRISERALVIFKLVISKFRQGVVKHFFMVDPTNNVSCKESIKRFHGGLTRH